MPVFVTVADDGRVSVVLKPKASGSLAEGYQQLGEYFVLSNPAAAVGQEAIALGFINKAPNLSDEQKQEARELLAKNRAVDYVVVLLTPDDQFQDVFSIKAGDAPGALKPILIHFVDP